LVGIVDNGSLGLSSYGVIDWGKAIDWGHQVSFNKNIAGEVDGVHHLAIVAASRFRDIYL
jgi:hypothetical protein